MSANISTAAGRQRRAKTWSSFGNLGRKPSEYEVVTHNMNHTATGPTPLELGPEVLGNRWLREHRDGIALDVAPLDAFRDPDALTYRKYTTDQDQQETYLDGLLAQYSDVLESDASLSVEALHLLGSALTPARYLGNGLQMLSAYVQQLARSSYVANCATFQTADQLRRVQRVAYRTRQLANAHPQAGFGRLERKTWEQDPDWQPTRKAIERLLVAYDWDQAFVGLNLVVKPLADELFLRSFAGVAREAGSELDALVAENLFLDAQRSRRWTALASRLLVASGPKNADHLRGLLAQWQPLGEDMVESAARLLTRHGGAGQAGPLADHVIVEWQRFLVEASLGSTN
jgi:toluene monooxygenase system protein E